MLGSSSFTTSRTESLGNIFNTGTPVANRDLVFQYTTTSGSLIDGVVEYFTPVGITGDYNNNGIVDAADYVLWRDKLNQSVTLPNDSTPGTVTQADYVAWRTNFGKSAGSGSDVAAAVPEAATIQLLILAALGSALARVRRTSVINVFVVSTVAGMMLGVPASAQLPPPPDLDRNYRMGDADSGPPAPGATATVTFDSQGVTGMQQLIDLAAVNGPRYETVTGRPDGGTGLGIRLNSTGPSQAQYLSSGLGRALNDPSTSISSTFQAGGTIDYSFVRDRGFQLWARPQTNAEAVIVSDSLQHGVGINASGQFTMRYAGNVHNSSFSVTPNTWYHLMVVRPFGNASGSILYVNGNAVAAATGGYNAADTAPLVVGANSSATAGQEGTSGHFQGLVDDLEMFVMGLNAAKDYGDFVFERDNKYAAFFKPSNAADLTGNNIVDMADVNVFVSNWLFRNNVGGLVVGDLASRLKGDFNYDGSVNLVDWRILNEAAPPGVGAAALAMINAIPEPTTALLAALASAAALTARRAKRPVVTRR